MDKIREVSDIILDAICGSALAARQHSADAATNALRIGFVQQAEDAAKKIIELLDEERPDP